MKLNINTYITGYYTRFNKNYWLFNDINEGIDKKTLISLNNKILIWKR
jgi:hypothetical protein